MVRIMALLTEGIFIIEGIISLPKNGLFRLEPEIEIRNDFLKIKKKLRGGSFGMKMGKKLFFYHRGRLVETAFSRLKRLFGSTFRSRKLENLKVEAQIKCWILNQMVVQRTFEIRGLS